MGLVKKGVTAPPRRRTRTSRSRGRQLTRDSVLELWCSRRPGRRSGVSDFVTRSLLFSVKRYYVGAYKRAIRTGGTVDCEFYTHARHVCRGSFRAEQNSPLLATVLTRCSPTHALGTASLSSDTCMPIALRCWWLPTCVAVWSSRHCRPMGLRAEKCRPSGACRWSFACQVRPAPRRSASYTLDARHLTSTPCSR